MPLTGAATAIDPVCPRAALHNHEDQQDDRIELGLAIGGIVIRGLTHSKSWGTNRDERRKGPLDQLDPGAVRTRMRAEAMPGEDPLSLPHPDDIADAFVDLSAPDCRRNGETVRAY